MSTARDRRGWILALGSNEADAAVKLSAARAALSAVGALDWQSEPTRTADIDGGDRAYLNQLLILLTPLSAVALRTACKAIESAAGRSPARLQAGQCDLDIDLVARYREVAGHRFARRRPGKCLRLPWLQGMLRQWQQQGLRLK